VSFDLRPPSLDELGLAQAIRTHAAKLQPSGLAITVHIDDALPVLSAALEVAIFRITIEAIHNTIKHADAHHVTIQLTMRPDTVFDDAHTLELLISDDGVGLAANHPIGVGLVSMRERAAELGGHFVIETTSVYLTCLRVQFPLANTVLYSLP